MKTKAGELNLSRTRAAGERAARKRAVAVKLSQLAFEALASEEPSGSPRAPVRAESAIRVYLGDKGAGQQAWPYPGFLRASETQEDVELELEVDPDLWLQFEAEAERQSVSTQQLLEHAAFYFAAEFDAGRISQRILDDLAETKTDASS